MDEYHLCVCVPTFVCVHVRACLDLCFPVKECAPACDRVCVYQQELLLLSKQGSARHMVSCVPCGCHGSRLPRGEMQEEGSVQEEQEEDCEGGLSGTPQ